MKSEDVYIQCIYSHVKAVVKEYNEKLLKKLEPKPPQEKRKTIRKVKHGKEFVGRFQREEDIPDEFFTRFFDIRNLDSSIYAEVRKYEYILNVQYAEGTFDIKDLVSNPKANGMTYIEALDRLYDKTDSVDYLERTFKKHMINLRRNWLQFNDKNMCLWGSTFKKIGDKFYISNANGSHLTCLCKLMQISGMPDVYFDMPEGFISSLKTIKTVYKNTPDDLEFILMFNRMYEILKSIYPDIVFYVKNAEKKGINVIGIEGTEIEITSVSDIINLLKAQPILIKGGIEKMEIIKTIEFAPRVVGEE